MSEYRCEKCGQFVNPCHENIRPVEIHGMFSKDCDIFFHDDCFFDWCDDQDNLKQQKYDEQCDLYNKTGIQQ